MTNKLLFLLIAISSVNCFSQISFEKGYYINNSDQRVECLIKNIDWENNPIEFEYKLSENGETKLATIKSIKEFGINNTSKYLKSLVKIDRSSETISKLSSHKNPIFTEEELFLQVLIEGKANLFVYKSDGIVKYFYSVNNSGIEQLVYKSYYIKEYSEIGINNRFKQQLWNNLKCSNFTIAKIENLDYTKKDLVRFFTEYNECNNHDFINYDIKQKRDLFNLNIRPGLNYSSLSTQNSVSTYRNADFDNEYGLRFGIELENILPFNKNKWAILFEPTYQYFKSEKELSTRYAKVEYRSIELPVGLRHNFFLNKYSNIFINTLFMSDLSINSAIKYKNTGDLDIKTGYNFAFGIGYKHRGKYSLEFRYQTDRDILKEYLAWFSDYKTISVIFGYRLFQKNTLK